MNGKGSSYACYDAEGDLLATLAPGDSQPTTRTYDPAGRLLASAHAGSTDDTLGTVANTYDEAGRITSTTDANGATAIFRYDADGNRLTRTASSAAWDGTSAQLPTFNSYQTTYAYNDADQLTGETDPAGRAYGFFFDGRGNLRGIQYPNGTFSWKETNPDGWTTNQLNRHGTITSATTSPPADATPVADYSYTYSLDGQKLTEQLTGPSSQTTTYAYDSIGRLLTYANVGGAGTSARYCYDFDSNRLQVTATSGAACGTSTYTYNPGNANSPGVDEVSSVGATNYHYTADGQIDCRGSGTVTPCPSTSDNFRWDGVGRLSGATVASKSVCYRFDPGGSLLRRVYDATGAATCTTASSTTNYLLGDLFETNASGAVTTRYQDGPAGALESDTGMPAAASDTYTRSIAIGSGWGSGDIGGAWSTRANSTVSTAQFGVSGSAGQISLAAASIRYTATLPAAVTDFDVKVRVKIAATPTGSGSGLGYYLFGRSDASGDNSYAFSLGQSLTNAGSLNIWKRVSGTPTSLASNGAWGTLTPNSYYWLRARETGTTLSFKAWADGTAEPTTWTLITSDTTYTAPGSVGVMGYQGTGGTLNPTLLWDDFSAANLGSATPAYLYYNGHGDLAAEANSSGVRTAAHTYDPFGVPIDASPANATSQRYTAEWDKQDDTTTGLILMGARPYDPTLGRFLAVDPIDGGSLNNYDYAGQDPINGYDLSGTVKTEEGGLPLGISTDCGEYGGQSCAGTEGNASDWTSWSPANKHPEIVVVPAFVIGCVFLCSEGAAAEALNSLTARFGARRALIAVALAIGADEGDQAAGPAAADRQRVAAQVYFMVKRLGDLVRIPQPSLITINRWLRSIWPRR